MERTLAWAPTRREFRNPTKKTYVDLYELNQLPISSIEQTTTSEEHCQDVHWPLSSPQHNRPTLKWGSLAGIIPTRRFTRMEWTDTQMPLLAARSGDLVTSFPKIKKYEKIYTVEKRKFGPQLWEKKSSESALRAKLFSKVGHAYMFNEIKVRHASMWPTWKHEPHVEPAGGSTWTHVVLSRHAFFWCWTYPCRLVITLSLSHSLTLSLSHSGRTCTTVQRDLGWTCFDVLQGRTCIDVQRGQGWTRTNVQLGQGSTCIDVVQGWTCINVQRGQGLDMH